jgi:hypothetical protein
MPVLPAACHMAEQNDQDTTAPTSCIDERRFDSARRFIYTTYALFTYRLDVACGSMLCVAFRALR